MQHQPRCFVMQYLGFVGEHKPDGTVKADGGQRLIRDVEQQYPAQCPPPKMGDPLAAGEFPGVVPGASNAGFPGSDPPGPAPRGTRDQCDRMTAGPPTPNCQRVVFDVSNDWQTPDDIGPAGPGEAGKRGQA